MVQVGMKVAHQVDQQLLCRSGPIDFDEAEFQQQRDLRIQLAPWQTDPLGQLETRLQPLALLPNQLRQRLIDG
ncbi:MAG: hypothetical protein ACK56I_35140, partial [bacterium]